MAEQAIPRGEGESFGDAGPGLRVPKEGTVLCLSGGGYRAMLFHLGALWRLNEFGYLGKLDTVSSVSGGSIIAALLALKWSRLDFDDDGVGRQYEAEVVAPIKALAGKMLEVRVVLSGGLGRSSIARKVTDAYRQHLFGEATLQDLPEKPNFVINATNVQSGALWRFTRSHMGDCRVGMVENPRTELAVAVAASAALPPFLSPVTISVDASMYTPGSDDDLQREPFTTAVVLTDGGVYDNLGLEAAREQHDTILVSDAGGETRPEPYPKLDWPRHAYRVLTLLNNQVRAFPKRHLMEAFELRRYLLERGESEDSELLKVATRKGAYWGIGVNIADYELTDALHCPEKMTSKLARMRPALERLGADRQERLINWGYAVCDAAMRKYADSRLPPPDGFPYPNGVA